MTSDNPIDRLTAALADRYVIERKLGSGGMAIANRRTAALALGNRPR